MGRLGLILALTLAGGAARAGPFVVRSAGADTAIAVDEGTIAIRGPFRAAWTYELFRGKGRRTQVLGILEVADCRTETARSDATVHYTAKGEVLSRVGRDRGWGLDLRGSNTGFMIERMCGKSDRDWRRVRAATVFDVYREVWR